MHFWPNPSITKSLKAYNVNKLKANRPKGYTDEEWNSFIAYQKLAKLEVLNKVPKVSQKKTSSKSE